MMTPRRFQHSTRFFHLNSGLTGRIWQTVPEPQRWALFCRALQQIQWDQDVTAHAFVLMGTHFHLLFATDSPNEHSLAEAFHQQLNALSNQTFDALETPLFCEPVLNFEYYKNAYRYIYRNPVEAGLAPRAEDYEYSSLQTFLGTAPVKAPVIDAMGLIQSPLRILDWLANPDADLGRQAKSWNFSHSESTFEG